MRDDDLPGWVAKHPVKWGVVSGVLTALVWMYLFPSEWWTLVAGLGFGGLNWFMWRAGGPAHRWRAYLVRRFPPHA